MQLISKKATAGFVAALALVPATAMAATINGGPKGEFLRGTKNADSINGHGGNDRIFGLKGDHNPAGDAGNDKIFGGAGNDHIVGDANNTGDRTSFDFLSGQSGDDNI